MKYLIDRDGFIIEGADVIEFGIWDEPEVEKWKLETGGNLLFYAIDNGYSVVEPDRELTEEERYTSKYRFVDGILTLNTEYVEPPQTIEERIADIETRLSLADETAIELYEYQQEQDLINAAQDETLIELFELINA